MSSEGKMRENYFKYSVIAVSVFMAIFSIASLHYSIRLVEKSALPEYTQSEMEAMTEKLVVKIKAGEIPSQDIEKILLASNEAHAGNFVIVDGLIKLQRGTVSILQAVFGAYIFILFMCFFRKRT